jgi:hypothetical protein
MSTVYDENSLSTALDIIENIESRYGRLADRLGEVRKSMPSENVETIADKCFELSVEIMRYKHYFSSVKKLVVGRQNIGLAHLL